MRCTHRNRDHARLIRFFVMPSYWPDRIGRCAEKKTPDARVNEERESSATEGSIRLLKLSKSYRRVTAVKELTMDIQPGELFVLLGQNGVGKTTLINTLTGNTNPTHGEAFIGAFGSKCGFRVEECSCERLWGCSCTPR